MLDLTSMEPDATSKLGEWQRIVDADSPPLQCKWYLKQDIQSELHFITSCLALAQ